MNAQEVKNTTEKRILNGASEANRHGIVPSTEPMIEYIHGPRYWAVAFVISSMYFLTTLDMTIATTSLVAITDDLGHFEQSSWVLTNYFLGYVGFTVILAKLSDILGRKSLVIGSILAFTVFSAGCAASQTMTQLIILRAFQGVGGGGSFALSTVLLLESVRPENYADSVTRQGISIVLGLVLGPVLGGAISENTTWRWIFWINIPIGAIAIVVAFVAIPKGFPYHGNLQHRQMSNGERLSALQKRVDLPGTILVLLATLSFTACFQEVGSRFPWRSAYVITLLPISFILWIALLVWERHVTLANGIREPVLSWNFFSNRKTLGPFLCIVFVGAPMAVTYFQLPQRLMLVNGFSSFEAAIRTVPFGAASAAGNVLSGLLSSKLKIPSIYVILLGSTLQVIGFALLGTLRETQTIERKVFGYQVIAGMGCTLSFATALILTAFTAQARDRAVAMGAASQFRAMGAAIGLAVVTSVFNDYVGSKIEQLGLGDQNVILQSLMHMETTPAQQDEIRKILSQGYNRQMWTLCAFGGAQIPAALMMWSRKQVVASD